MTDFKTAMKKASEARTVNDCRALFAEIAERSDEVLYQEGEITELMQLHEIATCAAKTLAERGAPEVAYFGASDLDRSFLMGIATGIAVAVAIALIGSAAML